MVESGVIVSEAQESIPRQIAVGTGVSLATRLITAGVGGVVLLLGIAIGKFWKDDSPIREMTAICSATEAHAGEQLTIEYALFVEGRGDVNIGLGASLFDSDRKATNDKLNDDHVDVSAGEVRIVERTFAIPDNVALGRYQMSAAIYLGPIGDGPAAASDNCAEPIDIS